MTYDLTFVPRDVAQTWRSALEVAYRARLVGRPDAATWQEIVAAAAEVLGPVTANEAARGYWLDHQPTGLRLSYSTARADITVPFRTPGGLAADLRGRLYELGKRVEAATGYAGYDPQTGTGLWEAGTSPP